MANKAKKEQRTDVYQMETDRVLEQLEQGIVPWHKPWCCTGLDDEALERAKGMYEQGMMPERIEYIFPELKESEDEGIYRKLIAFLKQSKAVYGDGFKQFGLDIDDAIAWLEKKGEQNDILKDATLDNNEDGLIAATIKEKCEQKPAEWSEEDESRMENLCHFLKEYGNQYYGALTLEGTIHWLKSLKDRIQPQPMQEWSEKDEQLYNDLSDTYFYNDEDYPEETYKKMLKRVLDWMEKRAKSLRPQSYWKPSEEMLEALYRATPKNVMAISEDEMLLDKLYQGLKYGRILS